MKIVKINDTFLAVEAAKVDFEADVLQFEDPDWMMSYRHLAEFLALPEDTDLGLGYRKESVKELIILNGAGGVLALLNRTFSNVFDCEVEFNTHIPQEFWNAMYPNPVDRATKKLETVFFGVDVWLFIGKKTGALYSVYEDEWIVCQTGDIQKNATKDGLAVLLYDSDEEELAFAALDGTDYLQRKIETPQSLLQEIVKRPKLQEAMKHYGLTDEEIQAVKAVKATA